MKTVQNLMRNLHPDWDTTKIGVESQRVMTGAQKLAKRIRDDIGRCVSDSLVLEHLPDAMREQFGREPPEDELKDWLVTCLLGPYGSLYVADFCCKYILVGQHARGHGALDERQ